MATRLKGLSNIDDKDVPDARDMKFGVVVSQWNQEITDSLRDAAYKTLTEHGARKKNITVIQVPGSFELTLGAQLLAETEDYDAIICLGCVIQGETRHFDFICQSVTQGMTELNLKFGIPFVFGVLTTASQEQARERAGGKYGNKGDEAAVTAIQMVALKRRIER